MFFGVVHRCEACDHKGMPLSPILRLLQTRAVEQGATPVTRDSEFLALAHWLDGMDVHTALVDSVSKFVCPAEDRGDSSKDFAEFDQDYVFVGVQWLKIYGICLDTKARARVPGGVDKTWDFCPFAQRCAHVCVCVYR